MAKYDLLIGGGANDFNLERLAVIAEEMGKSVGRLYHADDSEPGFTWDIENKTATWDDTALEASGAFLRYDVFGDPALVVPGLDRATGWYNAVLAWVLSTDSIRYFNRKIDGNAGLKPYTLISAERCGLRIPTTLVTNELSKAEHYGADAIAKPVAGGAYTKTIGTALEHAQSHDGRTPMPALVQRKLVYPEYRVFVIGKSIHAFEMHSHYVDYRPADGNSMRYIGDDFPCAETIKALLQLTKHFNCDYCACDFKTDPESGKPVFLELNNGPMFYAFDLNADGALCREMVRGLCS